MPTDDLDTNWLRRFRRNVKAWYAEHGRELPWRAAGDAYVVWVSEVMLQQTTVAAVVPYFERFLARFPDVASLAAAEVSEVLRLWEGLGYYSRGRNLHAAARVVVSDHDGKFPSEPDALQQLPGIGRYTAGAIVSFAFDRPAPIVEANTLRLYARLMGYDGDPRATAGQRALWDFAERILPRTGAGRFNQALMDLGATVCTINEPQCETCPVKSCCRAFADGTQAAIPAPKKKVALTDVTEATVAVEHAGRYLLRRRGPEERWAGLWDFPRFEIDDDLTADLPSLKNGRQRFDFGHDNGHAAGLVNRLRDRVREQVGLEIEIGDLVTEIRHGVTRYRIRLLCFAARCESSEAVCVTECRWVSPADFGELPLSVTGRKFSRVIGGRGHSSGP